MRARTVLSAGLLALTLAFAAPAPRAQAAQHGPFGLGGQLGSPTGLTGKVFFNDWIALDFLIGIAWWDGDHFQTQVDVLFHIDLKTWRPGSLDLYLGVGPKIGWYWRSANDEVEFGIRFPVGASWFFEKVPVELYVEVVPGGWFAPYRPRFDLDAGVGARYYF